MGKESETEQSHGIFSATADSFNQLRGSPTQENIAFGLYGTFITPFVNLFKLQICLNFEINQLTNYLVIQFDCASTVCSLLNPLCKI